MVGVTNITTAKAPNADARQSTTSKTYNASVVHEKRKRKDYGFWRQYNEKPSIVPSCPGKVYMTNIRCQQTKSHDVKLLHLTCVTCTTHYMHCARCIELSCCISKYGTQTSFDEDVLMLRSSFESYVDSDHHARMHTHQGMRSQACRSSDAKTDQTMTRSEQQPN